MARNSITAKLLEAFDAAGTLEYILHLLEEISFHHKATIIVESRSLHNLSTTTQDPTETINKIDLATIRQHFSPRIIKHVGRIAGHYYVADSLSKDKKNTAALLLQALRDGS